MRKIGCLPAALVTMFASWLGLYMYMSLWPAAEAVVELPMANAVARFQTWDGFLGSQPYTLRVDTLHGTTSVELWTNWGPAEDLALYRTPEDWLVGIGGGGTSVIVDVAGATGPRRVLGAEQGKTDDRKWVFLGYAQGNWFVPASARAECIALLGAGSTPYRKQYQVPHCCH